MEEKEAEARPKRNTAKPIDYKKINDDDD